MVSLVDGTLEEAIELLAQRAAVSARVGGFAKMAKDPPAPAFYQPALDAAKALPGQAQKWWGGTASPWLDKNIGSGAGNAALWGLGGAAGLGTLGAMANLTSGRKKKRPISSFLTGALLGGGLGVGGKLLMDYYYPPKAPAPPPPPPAPPPAVNTGYAPLDRNANAAIEMSKKYWEASKEYPEFGFGVPAIAAADYALTGRVNPKSLTNLAAVPEFAKGNKDFAQAILASDKAGLKNLAREGFQPGPGLTAVTPKAMAALQRQHGIARGPFGMQLGSSRPWLARGVAYPSAVGASLLVQNLDKVLAQISGDPKKP